FSQTNYTPYIFTTYAGAVRTYGSRDATGTSAWFNKPGGVMVDASNNVFVADENNSVIRRIDTRKKVTMVAGTVFTPFTNNLQDGTNAFAHFDHASGLAQDSNGNIYVADLGDNAIRKMTPQGTNWVVTTIAGSTNGVSGNLDGTNNDSLFFW